MRISLGALAVTCLAMAGCSGSPAPESHVPQPVAQTAPAVKQSTPPGKAPAVAPAGQWEQKAKAQWYPFELTDLVAAHKGDWEAVHKAKSAMEAEHAKKAAAAPVSSRSPKMSPDQHRAHRVLAWEFERVAKKQRAQANDLASKVLIDLANMKDPQIFGHKSAQFPDFAQELKNNLQDYKLAAAAFRDTGERFPKVRFTAPAPRRGMVGWVSFSFGPKVPVPAAKAKGNWGPAQAEIEMWWFGPVMPTPNGPVRSRPTAGAPKGTWQFGRIVFPYSLNRDILRR